MPKYDGAHPWRQAADFIDFVNGHDLPALQRLRFSGDYFDLDVAKCVGGLAGEWSSLREVEWDFGDSRLGRGQDVTE